MTLVENLPVAGLRARRVMRGVRRRSDIHQSGPAPFIGEEALSHRMERPEGEIK
jgi:hypothetical protein